MKTPTINSRVVKFEVLKGTATRASVNAVESRTTSLEGDVATAQSDISTLQGDVATLTQGIQDAVSTHNTAAAAHADIRTALAGKQDAGSYLTTTGTAADSAKLGGVAASGYSQTSHTHNYAGSSTPGGAATTAQACTGNAATATKLATARTLTIGAAGKTFNGSANVAWTLAEMGAAQKPSSGTWTPVLTADTPPTGVVLQQAYADFFILEGWCWFTFGFLVGNPGTGGAGRIKIAGMPATATSAYTGLARPQFAVNHNATTQLYQIPPGANYIYATGAVPQYTTLTVNSYIQGQGFFRTA